MPESLKGCGAVNTPLHGSLALQKVVAALACVFAGTPMAMADNTAADTGTSYGVRVDAGIGRFEGDYGLDDDTTVDVLNLSARWYLPQGEVQISVPYLRIDGPADIRFISGQPATGPGVGDDEGEFVPRTESGIGDVILQGEYYLMAGTASRPWVIGLARVKLPTGDEDKGLSTGAADFEAGVGLIQRLGGVDILADVGYTWVGSSSNFELRDVVRVGGGVSVPFGPDDRNNAYIYLENRTNTVRGNDDRRSVAVGGSTSFGPELRTRVTASVFFGLSDTTEDYGVYLTTGYRF
jgi:hypothetical protein